MYPYLVRINHRIVYSLVKGNSYSSQSLNSSLIFPSLGNQISSTLLIVPFHQSPSPFESYACLKLIFLKLIFPSKPFLSKGYNNLP